MTMVVFGEDQQDLDGLVTHQYAEIWETAGYTDACVISYEIDNVDGDDAANYPFLTITDVNGATALKKLHKYKINFRRRL